MVCRVYKTTCGKDAYWKRAKSVHIKTEATYNDGIALAARLSGFPRGSGGNAKEMVEAIARGERFPIPIEWKGFDRALECDRLIRARQAFKINYKDAQSVERLFSVRFAEIAFHEKRFYLDCWAVETDDNQDLPELRHGWCLRFDRILNIEADPLSPWINGFDSAIVSFRLYNGLMKAYERRDVDVDVDVQKDCLLVDRRISNSFWFIRSILPYGADCEILKPQRLRLQVAAQFMKAAERYQEGV